MHTGTCTVLHVCIKEYTLVALWIRVFYVLKRPLLTDVPSTKMLFISLPPLFSVVLCE